MGAGLISEPLHIDLLAKPAVVSGDMSADIASNPMDVSWHSELSVQVIWSGGTSPVGTVTLQGTNDAVADANWETIDSFSLSGNSGTQMIIDSAAAYKHLRVIYTFTSGVGTMDHILLTAK